MLPGFRFLLAAIVLSMSILVFGLGAAALLRAAHEEFAGMPSRRTLPEPVFAQRTETQATLALLRVEPVAEKAPENALPASAPLEEAPEAVPVPPVVDRRFRAIGNGESGSAGRRTGTVNRGRTASSQNACFHRRDQHRQRRTGLAAGRRRNCPGRASAGDRTAGAGKHGRCDQDRDAGPSCRHCRRACAGKSFTRETGPERDQKAAAGGAHQGGAAPAGAARKAGAAGHRGSAVAATTATTSFSVFAAAGHHHPQALSFLVCAYSSADKSTQTA